jgi:hypothetical protein
MSVSIIVFCGIIIVGFREIPNDDNAYILYVLQGIGIFGAGIALLILVPEFLVIIGNIRYGEDPVSLMKNADTDDTNLKVTLMN